MQDEDGNIEIEDSIDIILPPAMTAVGGMPKEPCSSESKEQVHCLRTHLEILIPR